MRALTALQTSVCSDASESGMSSTVSRRRSPAADPVSDEVAELIRVVTKSTPSNVQKWLLDAKNKAIDEELDQMVLWVLSDWDPDLNEDEMMHFLSRGMVRRAYNNIVKQVRQEVAAELARHKRSDLETFLETCVVE